jgi:hypothetical protein
MVGANVRPFKGALGSADKLFEFGANVSPWQRSARVPSGIESRGVESCVLHSPPDHGRFRFGAEDIDKERERYFNVQGTAYCSDTRVIRPCMEILSGCSMSERQLHLLGFFVGAGPYRCHTRR